MSFKRDTILWLKTGNRSKRELYEDGTNWKEIQGGFRSEIGCNDRKRERKMLQDTELKTFPSFFFFLIIFKNKNKMILW